MQAHEEEDWAGVGGASEKDRGRRDGETGVDGKSRRAGGDREQEGLDWDDWHDGHDWDDWDDWDDGDCWLWALAMLRTPPRPGGAQGLRASTGRWLVRRLRLSGSGASRSRLPRLLRGGPQEDVHCAGAFRQLVSDNGRRRLAEG